MSVCWIVMGPVDETAFVVPDIFAEKTDGITLLQIIYARSNVSIMLDQDRLSGRKPQDELLVRKSRSVVREDF